MEQPACAVDAVTNQFPLYVVSKGRSKYLATSRELTLMRVHHFIVVEPQQADDYRAAVAKRQVNATVLELDMSYKERYDLCDNLGMSKSTGPGPARNFVWDHATAGGHAWHWVMDDNILGFWRMNRNVCVRTYTPAFWRAMEDFALRYKNVAMAGPNYCMFVPRRQKYPPAVFNTRIYSCNLIRNDVPYRWRGRYNEDTILSLDMLKGGWCTVQFNAFLQKKLATQRMKGGNTAEFYHAEGTVPHGAVYADTGTVAKTKMLVAVHPDVARAVFRYGRYHHHVDYSRFKTQKLILRDGVEIGDSPNDYGMVIHGVPTKQELAEAARCSNDKR